MTYCVAMCPTRGWSACPTRAHQRGRGPHQHLPQDDRVRARRRPRAGADERRQPRHHPGGDQPVAAKHAAVQDRDSLWNAPTLFECARWSARPSAAHARTPRRSQFGVEFNASFISPADRRRVAAPVQHLRGGQLRGRSTRRTSRSASRKYGKPIIDRIVTSHSLDEAAKCAR